MDANYGLKKTHCQSYEYSTSQEHSQSQEHSHLYLLPEEMLLGIFSKLGVKDTLSAQATCTYFYHLGNDEQLWDVLYKKDFLSLSDTQTKSKADYVGQAKIQSNLKKGLVQKEVIIQLPQPNLTTATVSSNGSRIVLQSRAYRTQVSLWDSEGTCLVKFTGCPSIEKAVFSDDGSKIGFKHQKEDASIWSNEGIHLRSFASTNYADLVFSPNGDQVLTGNRDKTATLWNIDEENPVKTFSGHQGIVSSVAFHPDRKHVLTGSADGTAHLFEIETARIMKTFGQTEVSGITAVAFSSNGSRVALGTTKGEITIWDVETETHVKTFKGQKPPSKIVFLPEDKLLLSIQERPPIEDSNTIDLWDIENEKLLQTFDKAQAVSADGSIMVASQEKSIVKVSGFATCA